MSKKIQISQEFFIMLYRYFQLRNHSDELYDQINAAIDEKFEKLINHDLYTKSKIAPTPEEKEQARQEYLDRVGISKNFRY